MRKEVCYESTMGKRILGGNSRDIPDGRTSATVGTDIQYRRLTKLIGTTIKNPEGVELGKLNNVMIDTHGGKVAYGILSLSDSGFLGMNRKLAAVPWSVFRIDERVGTVMLHTDKATLDAVAFDRDEFPNLQDPQYSRNLHERFNVRPYWGALGYVPGEQQNHPAEQDYPMNQD
jgi:sporulation protein YlmC with PRC-barrel domain